MQTHYHQRIERERTDYNQNDRPLFLCLIVSNSTWVSLYFCQNFPYACHMHLTLLLQENLLFYPTCEVAALFKDIQTIFFVISIFNLIISLMIIAKRFFFALNQFTYHFVQIIFHFWSKARLELILCWGPAKRRLTAEIIINMAGA